MLSIQDIRIERAWANDLEKLLTFTACSADLRE